MSDDLICRTKMFNDTLPCFMMDEHRGCVGVAITECGLDLEGVPENEQTRELLKAAGMTRSSTVLSNEDAIKVAKERVPSPPTKSFLDIITYYRRVKLEADRFMATAEQIMQKMRAKKQ